MAHSPRNQYKTLDLSFNTLRARSPKKSRFSSNFQSGKFTPSTTLSSTQNSFYSKTAQHSRAQSSINNLELLIPSSDSVLFFSKYSANKIKNQISEVHRLITKDGNIKSNYRNRPIVNINKPELNLNSRTYLAYSPTKKSTTTSSLFKNYKEKRNYNSNDFNSILKRKNNFNNNIDSFNNFDNILNSRNEKKNRKSIFY